VRLVLTRRPPDPVRTDPLADGEKLVEPREHAHAPIKAPSSEGLTLQSCYGINAIAYLR
jgi:hypothetical protein